MTLSRYLSSTVLITVLLLAHHVTLLAQVEVVAYYPSWVRGIHPYTDIAYQNVTHIAHSFVWPNEDGTLHVPIGFAYPEMIDLAHLNDVKVLLSVGGFGQSYGFGPVSRDPALRERFINELLLFTVNNNYDGIDIDWEFPELPDKEWAAIFFRDLRAAVERGGLLLSLSIALPATDWRNGFEPTSLARSFDAFHVLTYDYHGTWTAHAGPNSPLYPHATETEGSVHQSVQFWTAFGLPAEAINVGIPFYGKKFFASDLYAPAGGGDPILYTEISGLIQAGWDYRWDDASQTPYLVNPEETEVVTFDDSTSIKHKFDYITENGLRGTVVWALSQDLLFDGSQPLLEVVGEELFRISDVTTTDLPDALDLSMEAPYPNPSNQHVSVIIDNPGPEAVHIDVFDVLGRKVRTKDAILVSQRHVTFQTSDLPQGLYFIQARSGSSVAIHRFSIVH